MSWDNTAPSAKTPTTVSWSNTPPSGKTPTQATFTSIPAGFGTLNYFAAGKLYQNVAGVIHEYTVASSAAADSSAGDIIVTLSADLSPFHDTGHTYEVADADGQKFACSMVAAGTSGSPYTFKLGSFNLSAESKAVS